MKKEDMSPPRRLIYTGAGDFIKIGQLFQEDYIRYGILKPNSCVLDVGCGIGRSAIPLIKFLISGSYDGFDIVESGIKWCQNNISRKHTNFNFKLVNVSNDLYKDTGSAAKDFVFPYTDCSFDLTLVISVFTHMLPDEVDRYLSEIHRVLKPGGYCYATFFLLNDLSVKNMILNNNVFNFRYDMGKYRLLDKTVTSANVAYEEEYIVDSIVRKHGFNMVMTEYGTWSLDIPGNPIRFQDVVLFQKI